MRSLLRITRPLRRYFSFTKPSYSSPATKLDEPPVRKTLATLRSLYASSTPITVLTAYDYPTALHADRAGVDVTLVGDSLGMVCLGYPTTQSVTVEHMIHHAQAARRGTRSALLVVDMPFGSYETSTDKAVDTAVRLVKETGVDAVKLEGGVIRAPAVRAIVDAGIAVMGHVGLLPQAVSRVGAFRAAGRSEREARNIIYDARALQDAGVFAIVVECVPARVAQLVTSSVSVPTIGIGSGSTCDGQVLVYHDLLRILNHPHHQNVVPKFCKPFAELGPAIDNALRIYCHEVRTREFPTSRYSPYTIPDDQFQRLQSFVETLQTGSDNEHNGENHDQQNHKSLHSNDPTLKIY